MSLKDYTEEQISETSMIEVAYAILDEQKKPAEYHALLKRVGEVKGLADDELTKRISHLYTEMSIDGRFVNLGDNSWGLRLWYPFDQTEEELSQAASKARKKKAKEKEDEDFDEDPEDYDEFEDLEDELDDLANEEDTDFEDLEEDFPDSVDETADEDDEDDR